MSNEIKNILIVSDQLSVVANLKGMLLVRPNYKIYTADSGSAAIEVHRSARMDLIIIGFEMKAMSGDELCRKIRAEDSLKHVSILMIYNDKSGDIEKSVSCGANGYIVRPFTAEQLIRKVASLIEVSHRHHYRILLRVSLKDCVNKETYFCSSQDISKSGMMFESDLVLSKGDIVVCSFFLPSGQRIVSDAETVRIAKKDDRQFLYGVKFANIKKEDADSIEAFVKKHEESQ